MKRPAFFLALALVMVPKAFATGTLYNAPNQPVVVDYQTLVANGGQVQVYCNAFNPPPAPLPPPQPERNCFQFRWHYNVNSINTSVFTCTADNIPVGMQKDCHVGGLCGSASAVESDCIQRCQSGEFDGLLPRRGWDGRDDHGGFHR
ncbi:MAG: hypothetical protein ACXVB8_09255 [Bdellovibrionota bacterium]